MEIYDRQIRVFGQQGQKLLQGLTVGLVGVGGIGSALFLLFVFLGVGCIIIIDPDLVELSNLNRLVGATRQDALRKRPKVRVMERLAARVNPDIKILSLQKSVHEQTAQRLLKGCDVIFGALDIESGRWVLNKLSTEHLIPYFDTGTGIQADSHGKIEHAGGQVRVVIPGLGCLNCLQGIDVDIAQQEMLPEAERQAAIQLGYIAGADIKAPAVASLNGVIASLAITEFMAFATGFRPVHRYVFYDFMAATVTAYTFRRDPHCFTCSPTGCFAIGDDGGPLPAELLIDETDPHSDGENHMDNESRNTRQLIADMLSRTQQQRPGVEGDPEGQWFVIHNVRLGQPFNRPTSKVMVKFVGDSSDPVIFVPDKIQLREGAPVCPHFLAATPCLAGWKTLCPHMFQGIGDELPQFVACLCGFLANPALCGFMGCGGREQNDLRPAESPGSSSTP